MQSGNGAERTDKTKAFLRVPALRGAHQRASSRRRASGEGGARRQQRGAPRRASAHLESLRLAFPLVDAQNVADLVSVGYALGFGVSIRGRRCEGRSRAERERVRASDGRLGALDEAIARLETGAMHEEIL